MKLYKTPSETICLDGDAAIGLGEFEWDRLFAAANPLSYLKGCVERGESATIPDLAEETTLPPMGGQEVWAAGVTYHRSRDARMEESKRASGETFYDRVYRAERPELFYKGSKRTVVGNRQPIRVRSDAKWSVPEPELTLAISSAGEIFGLTIGNDVSSRDIEGENPLYLPQAKVYDESCALGPCLFVSPGIDSSTEILLSIYRGSGTVFEGRTRISEIERTFESLVEYLYRDNTFPVGALLMTGTGIIPPEDFGLQAGDVVSIGILPIGTLENRVIGAEA